MSRNKALPRKGTLIIEDVGVYKLLACNYNVDKPMKGGLPADGPRLDGCLRVTVETDNNVKALRRLALTGELIYGTISMVIVAGTQGANDRKMRYVYFAGHIESIHEYYNNQNSKMMTTEIHIYTTEVYYSDADGTSVGLVLNNTKKQEEFVENTVVKLNSLKSTLHLDHH